MTNERAITLGALGRRGFLAASGAALLAACAGNRQLGTFEPTEVAPPTWRAGDRWTYNRTDFYTKLDAGPVTREIAAVGPEGIRVLTRTVDGRILDDAAYAAVGVQLTGNLSEDSPLAGRFDPPYERYAFPLVSGKTWQQSLVRTDPAGLRYPFTVRTRVGGWETVRAVDRDVRAIIIERSLYLGPKDSFTGDLTRTEVEWYAPDIGGPARLTIEEWYFDRRNNVFSAMLPGARYLYQLVSASGGTPSDIST